MKILATALVPACLVVACASRPPAPAPATPVPPPSSADAALRGQRCGRAEGSPVVRQTWRHGRSNLCDAALTTWSNVPHADRACATDADCVLVAGSCFVDALNRAARAKVKYGQLPCVDPVTPADAGPCVPWDADARCRAGCCSAERR